MKILISGGGVAGMTLAYWLHRYGHQPVVVERSPHGRLGGYGFDFHGTGFDIAQRMGVVDDLTPFQLPVEAVVYLNDTGKVTARLTTELLRKIIRGPYMGLMHSGLEEVLIDAISGNVEIRYQQSIAAVCQDLDHVQVSFADGTREGFDLLVGADGIHSRTRELVFGPQDTFARYLGYYMASYPLTDRYGLGPVRAHYTEPGRQVVVYPTNQPGELIALYLFKAPDQGAIPRTERRDRLRAAFAGMGWITGRLLADAPDSEAIFMDTMTQIEMPRWHHGRVGLIGDACGSMTLLSGQGVAMAMAGGYLLAEALNDNVDHQAAFRHYQQRMHHEVSNRQRNARTFARLLAPDTRLGVAASNLLTTLLLRERFIALLRRRFTSGSLLAPAQPTRT
ncbi:MAG: FAD-dependent monooxygenase [Pseudonocardia sp.]|nr:FAD-dependent monooxygenase [Pseudonocardia sp.]